MATPNLPQDILEEILLRLPVKSLIRFRSVSKPWRCLISSSPFAKLHFQRERANPGVRTQNLLISTPSKVDLDLFKYCRTSLGDEAALVSLDFPLEEPHQRLKILGSCNGLVVLFSFMNVSRTKNVFIWNPSTGDYKRLPRPCPSVHITYRYVYGFGYDSTSDDYKLLFGSKLVPNSPISTAIFSLRKYSWRMIENTPDRDNYYIEKTGVFVNGALYWRIRGRDISAFDLNREKFDVLSAPHDCSYLIGLGVVKDKLCTICYDRSSFDIEFWVMEDNSNKGSWTKLLRMTKASRYLQFFEVFCIFETHVLYRYDHSDQLMRYDAQEESIKQFRVANHWEAIAHTESLLSPNFYCNRSADEQHLDYRIREMKHTFKHILLS
ncbi:hypothetical protein PTKIN_Ptkin09bG0033200 [Pterospermum kingtungense]